MQDARRTTPVDLFAFGNRTSPRPPRAETDFHLAGEDQMIPPGIPPLPLGASTFGDPMINEKPEGHYHRLAAGTPLGASDAKDAPHDLPSQGDAVRGVQEGVPGVAMAICW